MSEEKISVISNFQSSDDKMAEYIITVVGKYFDIDYRYYLTNSRKRELAYARQISMYFIKKFTQLPLELIGKKFSDKNHATVLHSIKTINNLMQIDKEVRKQIYDLDKVIRYKAKANVQGISLEKDFYFIDFDNFTSIRYNTGKGIILTGFSDEEIECLKKYLAGKVETRSHQNTGIYIIEQNINSDARNKK